MTEPVNRLRCCRIGTDPKPRDDLLQFYVLAREDGIIPFRSRAGNHRFHTAAFAAIAEPARFIEEIMPPFSTDPVAPVPDLSIHHDPSSDASAQDNAKYHSGTRAFPAHDTPLCLSQGKTICIVGHYDRQLQVFF